MNLTYPASARLLAPGVVAGAATKASGEAGNDRNSGSAATELVCAGRSNGASDDSGAAHGSGYDNDSDTVETARGSSFRIAHFGAASVAVVAIAYGMIRAEFDTAVQQQVTQGLDNSKSEQNLAA